MKKNLKRVLISVAIIICAFSAIAFAAADGDEAVNYGALCLIPPLVTIVLAFVTKQTIISMFIGIWLGATIMGGWNPIDGLIGQSRKDIFRGRGSLLLLKIKDSIICRSA